LAGLHSEALRWLVCLLQCTFAALIIRPLKPQSAATPNAGVYDWWAGAGMGGLSAGAGIGGGTLLNPYLMMTGEDPRRAIGTSSAVGVFVGLATGIGFLTHHEVLTPILNGMGTLAVIAVTGIVLARQGVLLGQHVPVLTLKRMLAVVIMLSCTYLAIQG
jgi:uncharacterized membrane protein YfcA